MHWFFLLLFILLFLFCTVWCFVVAYLFLKFSHPESLSGWPHPVRSAKEQTGCGQNVNSSGHFILISHWPSDAICSKPASSNWPQKEAAQSSHSVAVCDTERFGQMLPSAAIAIFLIFFFFFSFVRFSRCSAFNVYMLILFWNIVISGNIIARRKWSGQRWK